MSRRPKTVLSLAGTALVTIIIFFLNKSIDVVPQAMKHLPPDVSPTTSSTAPQVTTTPTVKTGDWFEVARAVDGDTVELADGTKVRYVGVNTPETHHPTKGVQCYGKEAQAFNQTLVVGKKVRLVKDVSETDRYGRLLRFVYLEDGTFVNSLLLKEGYAEVMTYPPDVAKSKEFIAVQAEARSAKRGLWGFCSSTKF